MLTAYSDAATEFVFKIIEIFARQAVAGSSVVGRFAMTADGLSSAFIRSEQWMPTQSRCGIISP
jgi:hypothetical protein